MSTERKNTVLLIGSSIVNVTYGGTLMVTDGQPSAGAPQIWASDGGFEIEVDCGRELSTTVANQYNWAVNNTYHEFTAPYTDTSQPSTDKPSQLNFYLTVRVSFRNVSDSVLLYLGQGNLTGVFNNWWIGGASILNSSPAKSTEVFLMADFNNVFLVTVPLNSSSNPVINGTPKSNEFAFNPGPVLR